jgi:hypothetical protein
MATKDFMTLMKAKTTDLKPSLLSAEEAIKSQIVVLEPLRNLIPPLADDESVQLEQNIRKHGIKDPLTIWETTAATAGLEGEEKPVYILVDGHNRYAFSQTHKLDFRINLVRFASLDEVKEYMIDYQLGRRNLTPEQTSYLRGMRYLQQKSTRGSNLQADAPQLNVSESLAKEYGVSSRTIKRDGDFAMGVEKLSPSLKKEVLAGKTKLPKASLKALAKQQTPEPIEEADTVLAGRESKSGRSTTNTAKVEALQTDIRKLANGALNDRSCKQLLKKINALLQLNLSK